MIGRFLIDGVDAYSAFGVYAIQGGWNELIAWPPLKEPISYDFPEEDGEEVDLTLPVLNTREINVKFAISGNDTDFFAFVELLSDGAYHTFNIVSLGRIYKLRLVSHGEYNLLPLLGFMTFRFADDFPCENIGRDVSPYSRLTERDYIRIGDYNDGIPTNLCPLSDYGAILLEGAYAQLSKLPPVKQNLTVTSSSIDGVEYDSEIVVYQAKELKLSVLFRAETLAQLWNNYDALLLSLIQPDERALAVRLRGINQTFPFYYKKCTVREFFPDGKIWLELDIELTLTREFHIESDDYLLATESGELITTEGVDPKTIRILI